jgi:hypothetical protein
MGRKKQQPKKVASLEKLQLELKETLEALGGCIEVVSASSRGGDLRLLCRANDEEYWLRVLADFLENEGSWYSFIGKKYFIKQGRLVFGWVLIFESEDLDKTIQETRKLLLSIHANLRRPTAEIASGAEPGMVEIPLPYVQGSGYEEKSQDRVKPIR